jgi:hypothetical protein
MLGHQKATSTDSAMGRDDKFKSSVFDGDNVNFSAPTSAFSSACKVVLPPLTVQLGLRNGERLHMTDAFAMLSGLVQDTNTWTMWALAQIPSYPQMSLVSKLV